MTTNDVNQRPNYFAGQYLLEDDFELEQKYHIDRQQRHNRLLHVSGIAEGLQVTQVPEGGLKVKVSPGTAVDKQGQQIILVNERTVDVPGNGDKTLFIKYAIKEDSLQEGTTGGYRRIVEEPVIDFDASESSIALAKLTVADGKITKIDEGVRQYSGLRLPGAETSEVTLRYQGDKKAVLKGNLEVTGLLTVGNEGDNSIIKFQAANSKTAEIGVQNNSDQGFYILTSDQYRLSVNQNGNVGIGTDSPQGKLHIVDQSSKATSDEAKTLVLGPANASNLRLGYHENYSWIQSHGNKPLAINSEGNNVGIGTTAPSSDSILTIKDDNAQTTRLSFKPPQGNQAFVMGIHKAGYNNGDAFVWNRASTSLLFGTSNLHRMIINKDGKVGIGTTDPKAKLEVNGNTRLNGALTVTGNTDIGGKVSIKDGNVGIGATDPKEKLEVAGNLKFSSDGNGIEFFGGAKIFNKIGSGLKIQAHNDTQGVEFLKKDGSTSIMVLKDGNVGISTTDPKAKLDVRGDIALGYKSGGGSKLLLTNQQKTHYIRANDWWTEFVSDPSQGWKFISIRDDGTIEKECLRITSKDGNVGIGTTNPSGKLQIDGSETDAKIKFGGKGGDVHHISSERDIVINSQKGEFWFRKTKFDNLDSYQTLFHIDQNGNLYLRGKVHEYHKF